MTYSMFDEALKEIEPKFFSGLRRIMQINSVKGEAQPNAPFGLGPKKALEETLNLAKELGFTTKIINDAMGYAQLGDDNENYIGVVGHIDVVPEGTDWDYPPFDLTLDNDVFYGRGVLDNKGPIIANLYALYLLKEMNYPFTKTIRIIFGTDEESGSADIPLYLKEEVPPMYGYTPDCKYPAVYGERGVLGLSIKTKLSDNSQNVLTDFSANFDRSAVPDTLHYSINNKAFDIKGKRAPSNAPDMGENVITYFANEAKDNPEVTGEFKDYLTWLAKSLHLQHDGAGLNINFFDEESGYLSLTPYSLFFDNQEATLNLSMRYPVSTKKEDIINTLNTQLPKNSTMEVTRDMPSTNFDKEHPMVKTMTEVYEYATGLDGTPVTTTGATYARSMPNIMAFGPSFPGQKGIAHNKNEYMDKKDLLKNLEIYTYLLSELGK